MPLILVPSSFTKDERGKFFEGVVADLLTRLRYTVTERVRFTGMEIDVLADHKDTRERAYAECKFERDPFAAEVVYKLLGKGVAHRVDIVYLFSVSEPGKEAKGVIDDLMHSERSGPRFAFVGPEDLVDHFRDLRVLDCDAATVAAGAETGGVYLAIAPDMTPFWISQQLENGMPVRCVLLGDDSAALRRSLPRIMQLFEDNEVLGSLPVVVHGGSASGGADDQKSQPAKETVSPVVAADSLVDYRPCRPQDFVGRDGLQKEIWTFLERVRARRTDSRVLALFGPSGFGKSSTIVKLADRFGNKRWRKRVFLHPVDARAAVGPLFVAAAVKAAFDSAVASGFISIGLDHLRIESSETVLESPDIVRCLEWLEQNNRLLVLFFDQFEEMLFKHELQPVFEAFRRLAFEVNARQGSLVLGFSWRTGITIPDGNAAYYVWHSLSDIRMSLEVGRFEGKESSRLVTLFQQALGQTILPPLRRRLIEQSQGIPWLLKKLCIHTYREMTRGISQQELLERRLNIESLFQEDLELPSSEREQGCLRFIAKGSPVAVNEVTERFGEEAANSLYARRLIVRAGDKYAIYWDVFRDYLNEGKPPPIPWTYVPVVSVAMAMRGLREIQQRDGVGLDELARVIGYSASTTVNIVGDLQNLVLITREADGAYVPHPELKTASAGDVARYLHELFGDHKGTRALADGFTRGERISASAYSSAVEAAYVSAGSQPDHAKRYARKLQPWLRFSGHIDRDRSAVWLPESGVGRDLGSFVDRGTGQTGAWLFLGSASGGRVTDLALELSIHGTIGRDAVLGNGDRNAADDLSSLRLARREGRNLVACDALASSQPTEWKQAARLVARAAGETAFVSEARRILAQTPEIGADVLGARLAQALGKSWSAASRKRYGAAARRWLRFVDGPDPE